MMFNAGESFAIAMIIAIMFAGIGYEVAEWRRKRRIERNYREYKGTRRKPDE